MQSDSSGAPRDPAEPAREPLGIDAPPENDSVSRRIARYETSVQRSGFIAAGFGGLLLLLSTNEVLAGAPVYLGPIILTIVLIGAGCIGYAYTGFLKRAGDLRADAKERKLDDSASAEAIDKYTRLYHHTYVIGSALLLSASVLMVFGAWFL